MPILALPLKLGTGSSIIMSRPIPIILKNDFIMISFYFYFIF